MPVKPVTTCGLSLARQGIHMRIDAATAFALGDLAVFDATHLRQVIGEVRSSSGTTCAIYLSQRFAMA